VGERYAAWGRNPGSLLHALTGFPEGQPYALCKAVGWAPCKANPMTLCKATHLFPCKAIQPFPCEAGHTPFDRPAIQRMKGQLDIPRQASLTRPDRLAEPPLPGQPYTASLAPSISWREV
jgi:hypothetical protein